MNDRTSEHRRAQRRVLIGLGVVAALAGAGVIARRSVSQPKIVEPPDVALNGSVNCSGDAVQITNNDATNWLDARVEINSKYARIVPSIPPGQTVTLPAAQLTDSSGNPFAPSATAKCQSADIQAYMRGARGHFKTANLDGQ
jgi:hypothetical protein